MSRRRYYRRTRSYSYSPQLVGVVLGGIVGVALAYCILLHCFNIDVAPAITDLFRQLDTILSPERLKK